MIKKKKVTFSDIAAYTHFSKTTISRYFNNRDSLTLENQKIIEQALIDLDYHENKLAKILANGKTEYIGVIIPKLSMSFYSDLLSHLLSTYEKYGYKFLVFESDSDINKERQYLKELLAYKIEGLIILSHLVPSSELASYNIPVVAIEREADAINCINTDNYQGAVLAALHLIENQCEVMITINAKTSDVNPDKERTHGFVDTCHQHNVPCIPFVEHLGKSFDETNQIFHNIFNTIEEQYKGKKKGIFLSNDNHANILLNIIYRKYGKLPADYQLIGFDDSSISREAIIPITTIQQQIPKMADSAMSVLVDEMNERKKRVPHISNELHHELISPHLIVRQTTNH